MSTPLRALTAALAATAAAVLLPALQLGALVLPAAVVLLTLALPPVLGLTSRALAAIALLFAGNTALAFVTLQPQLASVLWVLPAAVVVGYRGVRPSVGATSLEDALTAAVTAVTSAALLLPWATREPSGQLAYMTPGEDNASHLSIVSGIRNHGSFLYGASDSQAPGVLEGLRSYPQGAHANVALVADVVQGSAPFSAADAVQAYSFAMLLATALLVVALSVLAIRLARLAGAAPSSWALAAAIPPAVVLGGPALSLLSFGFFTQVVAYAALAILCALAADDRWDTHPWWRLVVLGSCTTAIASSFYFLLPVVAVTCAAVLWTARDELRRHPARSLLLVAATAGLSLPHVASSLTAGATDAVNANGGVRYLDRPVLLLSVVGATLFLLRTKGSHQGRLLAPWACSLLAAAVFTLAFRRYQLNTAGAVSYYFYKSLFTVHLLALVALAAGAALALSTPRRTVLPGLVSAAGLLAFLTAQSGHLDNELHRTLYVDTFDLGYDAALAALPAPGLTPVLFWGYARTVTEDYNRNRQVGAMLGQDTALRATTVAAGFREQQPASLLPLVRAGGGLILLTRDAQLPADLATAGLTPAELATVDIRLTR